jgi:hypothetical protein
MTKIIKLTESQLRDVVQKVINEQGFASDFVGMAKSAGNAISNSLMLNRDNRPKGSLVDQIYNEFVYGGTGAKATSHTFMATAINKIPNYKTLIEFNNKFKQDTPAGFKSFVQALQGWLKVGEENIFKNIQAKLKTLGVSLIISNPSGIFKPADIRIEKGGVKKADPKKIDPNKPTYKVCTAGAFPIKYGCKQTEVGTLQKCMGMGVDYSFGPDTLKAFLKLNPDPKAKAAAQKQILEVGLSEGAYKLVIAKCKSKIKKIKKPAAPAPAPTPVPAPADTRTKTEPLTLKSRTLQTLPTKSREEMEKDVRASLEKQLKYVNQVNPGSFGVNDERAKEILNNFEYRRIDDSQVYKGGKLTDNELKYVNAVRRGEAEKNKLKNDNQDQKLVYPNR